LFALIISVPGMFFINSLPEGLKGLIGSLKAWYLWLFLAGIIGVFAGGYYFVSTVKSLRKFKKFMKADTKTQFAKNLPELERLAMDLPDRYAVEMERAKDEFGTEG